MNAQELLEELRLLGEHEKIEAKQASLVGHAILETICAFSNEPRLGGGTLLLGVAEDKNSLIRQYPVVGIADPDKITNDLLTQCRTAFNVAISPRITPERVEGKTILTVVVPEAEVGAKPVFFKDERLPRGALRRIGSGDIHCTEDDLLVFYESRSVETYDSGLIEHCDLSDIDSDAVDDYRRERARGAPESEELRWSDEELLYALACVRKIEGGYRPTVAGILLFGTKIALRRVFPMTRLDYIRVPGREWVPDPDSRFVTIEIRDPLMRAVRRAQAAVLDDLPEAFHLPEGQMQRQGPDPIFERVFREAIVNAVMHRSYRQQRPVQIIRYSNRLEIRNPGYSLKNEEHLGEPGSDSRNPKIAAVLHETRFAETKGSGVRVMRELMEKADLSPPLFESDRSRDSFVVTFSFHHFLSSQDWEWLAAYKAWNLSNDDARALVWVRENGAIANSVYRNLNRVSVLEASRRLGHLRDCGILEQVGRSTATHYVPGSQFNLSPNTPVTTLTQKENVLTQKKDELTQKENRLTQKGGSSSREELLAALPVDLRQQIETLGHRQPDVVRELIEKLCALRPWRTRELSVLLNRETGHLTRVFLTPMVKSGRLERLFPTNSTHSGQAYCTP